MIDAYKIGVISHVGSVGVFGFVSGGAEGVVVVE